MKTLLLLGIAACGSSSSGDRVACASGAAELATKLHAANGYNMDLTKADVQQAIAAAKADVLGKQYAFADCAFEGQGNDRVWFAATSKAEPRIECVMAGGAAGNKEFRHAAVKLDRAKLKLDVSGTVKEVDGSIELADCEITPHE